MQNLPNGCYCSAFHIYPKNWKTTRASVKKDWYISYRFYDPAFLNTPKFKYGKLVITKGMNSFKTPEERRKTTEDLITTELHKLQVQSFNPITGQSITRSFSDFGIAPTIPFIKALEEAEKRCQVSPSTKRDFRSALRFYRMQPPSFK